MVKDLIKDGWTPIKKTKHWKIKSEEGAMLTIPHTPSDSRAIMNFKADIRRTTKGNENEQKQINFY